MVDLAGALAIDGVRRATHAIRTRRGSDPGPRSNQGSRPRGRPKGSKNRKKRTSNKQIGQLSHRALQRHYRYNNMGYCVTEDLGMYNAPRAMVAADAALTDYQRYHDSFVITNNGVIPQNGSVGTSNFSGHEVSYWARLDFTQNIGKWFSTGGDGTHGQTQSNQVFALRKNYKKWRKEHLKLTIKWRNKIDNAHALQVPEGYYMVVPRVQKKVYTDMSGIILNDITQTNDIYKTENMTLTGLSTLDHKYGRPSYYINDTTAAGEFPGATAITAMTPPPQETFTYENIARNPKGWKRIPKSRQFDITHSYKQSSSFTTINNAFIDPVIIMVFKEIPPSWLQTSNYTSVESGKTVGTSTFLETSPQFTETILPACVCDIMALHCYRFTDRAEDIIDIPASYPSSEDLIPY